MEPLYIVTERCDPSRGSFWDSYVAWSGLTQLTEVVTVDSLLCPYVLKEVLAEDWAHIVNEDFMLDYFHDLPYLLRRVGHLNGRNLLCVFRNPVGHVDVPRGEHGFSFEGYDLVDVRGGISALTNCGGFPNAFSNAELSSHGLLSSLARAREVAAALPTLYPAHGHEQVNVWAIYRALTPREG